MPARPDVSIVIPTRDSAVQLRRCLASLTENQGASFEILVVDQQSTDATHEVAHAGGAILLQTERPDLYAPPTRSRNVGAAAARGDYLVHIDADMALAPGILGRAVHACRHDGHVALILEEVDVTAGFWAACKALERKTYRASELEGARFVRTDIFRAVGGYDEKLGSGEDWDIHARYLSHGSIGRLPGAVYHHLGLISFAAQTRKKFTYGKSATPFLGKHRASAFSGAMLASYARSWRVFAADPPHTLGFLALRTAEAAALTAGIAVAAATRLIARWTKSATSSDNAGAAGT